MTTAPAVDVPAAPDDRRPTDPRDVLRAAVRPVRSRVLALAVLSLLLVATRVVQGALLAAVLVPVLRVEALGAVTWPVLGVLLAQAVRVAALPVRERLAATTAGTVAAALRRRLYDHLLALGPMEARRRGTGALRATLVDAVEDLVPTVTVLLPRALAGALGALAVVVVLLVLDPVVGLVVAVAAAGVALVAVGTAGRAPDGGRAARRARLAARTLDALQGMATLRLFGAAARRGRELSEAERALADDELRADRAEALRVGLVAALAGAGAGVALGLGAVRLAQGVAGTAAVVTALFVAREALVPLRRWYVAAQQAPVGRAGAAAVHEVLAAVPEIRERPDPVRAAAVPLRPALSFVGVRYTYPGRTVPALDGFDLQVKSGERVAVVGPSGAGKSTIVATLLRWVDPQEGRVLLGGIDVRDLALADLRALVSVVSQDVYLFRGTVRDNLGAPGVDDPRLWEVLDHARAGFVRDLPDGLDTVVGERGTALSGGERQRLAIARALLADSQVLVLDEATSNLDAANESELAVALHELSKGKTTLTVAHRLSTVTRADRIVVLERGRVSEAGLPLGLRSSAGSFARMTRATREGRPQTGQRERRQGQEQR